MTRGYASKAANSRRAWKVWNYAPESDALLFRNFKPVPDAPQSFEILRVVGVAFDLFAQAADVDVDRARSDKGSFLPDGVEKLIPRENTAAVCGEVFEQAKLSNGSQNVAAANLDGHGRGIDFQFTEP